MGNFYTNYTLKGPTQQSVAAAFAGRAAIVSPRSNDCVVAFDQATEQNPDAAGQLARQLSSRLQCPTLVVMNHDDDILWYQLYDRGQLLDTYDSCPGYFNGGDPTPSGGDAQKLSATFARPDAAPRVEQILRGDHYVFALERHQDLVHALGLPEFAVGGSYEYINSDESPEGLSEENIIRTQ